MNPRYRSRHRGHAAENRQAGFSLVELMIALTLSMIIGTALLVIFSNVLKSNREQFKAAQQIENGRFAIDLVTNNVQLAGYYGEFSGLPSAASFAALPDPCEVNPASTVTGRLKEGNVTRNTTDSPLAFYVQGYRAANATTAAAVPTRCQDWIDAASIKPGSDILVVRRFDSLPLIDLEATPPRASATPESGRVYVQAVYGSLDVQYGAGALINACKDAKNAVANTSFCGNGPSPLTKKDYTQALAGPGALRARVAAEIRALHTDIYYVSPCRDGTGANGKCAAGDDTIPTLKRLELTVTGGTPTMSVVPLIEGIDFFKVTYGLDNGAGGGTANDGRVDQTVSIPATLADWQNVVMMEIRVIARNTTATQSYVDDKTYDLGSGISYTPTGEQATFKRHVFTQKIYLPNIGGRRES